MKTNLRTDMKIDADRHRFRKNRYLSASVQMNRYLSASIVTSIKIFLVSSIKTDFEQNHESMLKSMLIDIG